MITLSQAIPLYVWATLGFISGIYFIYLFIVSKNILQRILAAALVFWAYGVSAITLVMYKGLWDSITFPILIGINVVFLIIFIVTTFIRVYQKNKNPFK